MKRNFVRAGALIGAASLSLLVAGPSMAATAPVSQATAQGLNLYIAGNHAVTGTTTATNDGTVPTPGTQTTNNTLPPVAGVVPQTNAAGLGVVLQDAVANPDGFSTACAGTAGQGGGLVQVGSQPCSVTGGSATSVNLATLNLGSLVANPNSVVGQVVGAIPGLNGIAGQLQAALVGPLSTQLASSLGNVGLGGSLGVVAGHCQATPTAASGGATIANSAITLTTGGQTVSLVDLPADPAPNTHPVANPAAFTQVVLNAVDTQVSNTLANPVGSGGTSPVGQLGLALSTLAGTLGLTTPTGTLAAAIQQVTGVTQNQIITPLNSALQPLLDQVQSQLLNITLNEQPVPQQPLTFETTALDLQLLPAASQFTGGNSLIGGIIGHVKCGPNTLGGTVSPSPSPSNSNAANPGSGRRPASVNSGQGGAGESILLGSTAALLGMSGGLGLMAYRRYWMPRG